MIMMIMDTINKLAIMMNFSINIKIKTIYHRILIITIINNNNNQIINNRIILM